MHWSHDFVEVFEAQNDVAHAALHVLHAQVPMELSKMPLASGWFVAQHAEQAVPASRHSLSTGPASAFPGGASLAASVEPSLALASTPASCVPLEPHAHTSAA